jgi:Ser/Thr protein kinase RdoA (MazF antagonist)
VTPVDAWNWPQIPTVTRHDVGLINQTYTVTLAGTVAAILQRLNTDIFVPEVHEDIEAITAAITAAGLPTTSLLRTKKGTLWHTASDGSIWRALTPVGDRTVEILTRPEDAREAGALVGRFHTALRMFHWDFRSVRSGAHDTDAHMDRLARAVNDCRSHRLWWDTASLSETIGEGWRTLQTPRDLPMRIVHGDLKISNLRFTGDQATALIDLDTLAWGTLDLELGDAMRSWCNTASEDDAEASFDLDLFRAAMTGYARGTRAHPPTEDEWNAVLPGLERICWELAARFAWDALSESYFGWDSNRYPAAGEHNLVRARGQVQLARSVRAQHSDATDVLRQIRQAHGAQR